MSRAETLRALGWEPKAGDWVQVQEARPPQWEGRVTSVNPEITIAWVRAQGETRGSPILFSQLTPVREEPER